MSSITDKPISSKTEDLLDVEKYAQALSGFIKESDTPITIGLQGEWGTGKTSLMGMLLEDFQKDAIACSWVNTWEYSMFKGAHETTPGVLKGMLEKLQQNEHIAKNVKETKSKLNQGFRIVSGLINQVVSNQIGIDVKSALNDSIREGDQYRAEIAEIKNLINQIIQEIVNDASNPYQKIVFFVDDLDRIPPSDAVEILEALKNIFDIPNCVFVLAIDYDVVVKGLESKFGQKTEENEREFRSFFDKIIQVPFSMPTGAYLIEKFLDDKLKAIGNEISAEEIEKYVKVVKWTIGYNPRSLKRYLNSFSLIKHLMRLNEDGEAENIDDLMLFILLGVQISYPKIFRMLTMKSDFTSWNIAFANKMGLDWELTQEKLKKVGENELVDEEWEQVTWGLCQSDSYLKSKVYALLELLNETRSNFGSNLEDKLDSAMAFAAITSVDDNVDGKQAIQKVGNKTKYGGLDIKIEQLRSEGYSEEAVENYKTLWEILTNAAEQHKDFFAFSLAKTGASFNDLRKKGRGNQQLIYCTNPSNKTQGMTVYLKRNLTNLNGLLSDLKSKFPQLEEGNRIHFDTENKDIIVENSLAADKFYRDILQFIAQEITKF